MKMNKSLVTLALITTMSASFTTHAITPQTIKTKDFYINRIATNSKDVINLERIMATGLGLKALFLAGPLGIVSATLGDIIITLSLLAYGPQLLATFIAVDRLEKTIKKEPELLNTMSTYDKKIFATGKATLKGALLNYIHKQTTIDAEIKKTAESFVTAHPELTTIITQKNLKKAVINYLTWSTDIKTYEETRQKEADIRKNLKAGLFTPIIKTALSFVDKFIAGPAVTTNINTRKKNMDTLLHKKYPDLGKLVASLQTTADQLFEQLKNIKSEHERTGKNLSREPKKS